jgi:hypothetical protein
MTDTLRRGTANQAGAHINANAAAEAQDFLPLKGIDHVEFWVANAKQAAAYYRAGASRRSPTPGSRRGCATAPAT